MKQLIKIISLVVVILCLIVSDSSPQLGNGKNINSSNSISATSRNHADNSNSEIYGVSDASFYIGIIVPDNGF